MPHTETPLIDRPTLADCSLCAKHDNSLLLLPFFRQPAVLSAPPSKRLSALFASSPHAAKALDEHCPMRASMGNALRTGTVIRRPVDRVISKYFFLRTCAYASPCPCLQPYTEMPRHRSARGSRLR